MGPIRWMAQAGFSNYSLAKEWGMAPSSLWRQLNGKREPSFEMMVRFHIASRGEVKLSDWIRFAKPDIEALGVSPKKRNGK